MKRSNFSPLRRAMVLGTPLLAAGLPFSFARAQAQAGGQVVVYVSANAQSAQAVTDVARKQLRDVKLSMVAGGTGQLLKRVEAEAASPRADIFWTAFASSLERYKPHLAEYRSPELAAIPEKYVEQSGLWAASNVHVAVAMLNARQFQGKAPASWRDLTDPRFKGKIIVSNPEDSSTAFTILWWIEKNFGAEVLAKIAANCVVTPSGSNVVRSVGQGEYAVGITYESIAYPYVAGGQRGIRLMYAEDGTFEIPDDIALIRNGPNPAAARRAYDLILSREVQIALLETAFRRPSRSDIKVSEIIDMPDLSSIKLLPFDEAVATADRDAFLARWRALPKAGGK
ncbi:MULTISPECIES: extracellular solute-binding protein [Achromobacter]|uniref:Extracellular solute-binding protein n=1 Tax=Achromobacter denitrificans TaxID=32002 RepID=A0A6N0JJ69_ACHDE|nr:MULTISPECIES: extracellular solute-binding protein [Achromobacter]QKQ47093.1 extracellular solute-binding protein [Achromobacter denitrificans]